MTVTLTSPEVLTLSEAAEWLRIPESSVVRLVAQQGLPGRLLDGEWMFLKHALEDWMRTASPRQLLLKQLGAMSDDESLSELRAQVYRDRGRSEIES